MKNLYYEIYDTTRRYADEEHALFGSQSIMSDIAGLIVAFAKRNRISPDDVRMYVHEKKSDWEAARSRWIRTVLSEGHKL